MTRSADLYFLPHSVFNDCLFPTPALSIFLSFLSLLSSECWLVFFSFFSRLEVLVADNCIFLFFFFSLLLSQVEVKMHHSCTQFLLITSV